MIWIKEKGHKNWLKYEVSSQWAWPWEVLNLEVEAQNIPILSSLTYFKLIDIMIPKLWILVYIVKYSWIA